MNYDNTNKGAMWLRTSKNGLKYMSGTLNVNGVDFDIAMFKNDKKGNENAPDYRLTISNKKESGQAVQDKSQAKVKTSDTDKVYVDFGNLVEDDDGSELPF